MQTNPSIDPFLDPEEKPLDDDPASGAVPDADPLAPGASPEDERDPGKDQPVAPEDRSGEWRLSPDFGGNAVGNGWRGGIRR